MNLINEITSILRFLKLNEQQKEIVFYTEHEGYYSYYEGLINNLLDNHSQPICYISSDKNDPIFKLSNPRFHTFYINKLLSLFLSLLSTKILIMTMPDLNSFHIKRSINPVHYVYKFHSMISTHMGYLKSAFDNFDTIFCTGSYQLDEIEASESVRELKKKNLVSSGYYRVERIHDEFFKRGLNKFDDDKNTVLIAPSWGSQNILEFCGAELISMLLKNKFHVIVRPHPETLRRTPDVIYNLEKQFKNDSSFKLERSILTDDSLLRSDILICDLSGVALEYAFGTERPVLFLDVPFKIRNEDYADLNIEPFELAIRSQIGKVVSPDEIIKIPSIISELLKDKEVIRKKIIELRNKSIFNFGRSSEIEARFILDYLKNYHS